MLDAAAQNAPHRIGPNAIIQVAEALRALHGEAAAKRVFGAAGLGGLLDRPPEHMTDERAVFALHSTLHALMPGLDAAQVATDAGRRTADYLLANRIPNMVQWLLRALPAPLAAPVLLRAISRNAWTFAGSGHVLATRGNPAMIEIKSNPVATGPCHYHIAVFERLFRVLVHPRAEVHESTCCAHGAVACRFTIALPRRRR
ncbi:MAG: bacteriochlorophyll 4-vinyl reductase [Roseomonas sp.]|jgi:divinyl protochlorophyllide a 8-vinyl-reductase|nr:bacteriochlorophyll 4-vinyl reductase [Roseomonas sp.]MBX9700003.1 bacteriochlorophyll 4-vinyl reductase [Acetobacteraceae bacterium]